MKATFAQRCVRIATLMFAVTGLIHALTAPTLFHRGIHDWAVLVELVSFLLGRFLAPILLLAAACEFIVRRVDEFVTARWQPFGRK
jgi:hypothetical protein